MIGESFSVAELAILFAAIAYVADRVLDGVGWSRSSRTLRQENEDLVRRNRELDADVVRLRTDVERLQMKVTELEARDQAAVLKAIELHEQAAGVRHERMVTVLTEIRDAVKAA